MYDYYYYVKSLQGDVTKLYGADGTLYATYKYDAWGNHTVTYSNGGASIAAVNTNPIRYRSYYYDNESNLYYLNSRYYSPVLRRFISADGYVSTGQGFVGFNMYAYCNNNPVMYVDYEGEFPWLILTAAILLFTPVGGTAVQTVTSVLSYAVIAVASIFDEDIQKDMNKIGWNPFNTDESDTLESNKVSFYKGVPVFRIDEGRSWSFGAIFLNHDSDVDDLRHERGHNWQLMMMGVGTYAFTVGIPSPLKLGSWDKGGNYYGAPWETMADILGGVKGSHDNKEIINAWGYYAVSTIAFPFTALYWLR